MLAAAALGLVVGFLAAIITLSAVARRRQSSRAARSPEHTTGSSSDAVLPVAVVDTRGVPHATAMLTRAEGSRGAFRFDRMGLGPRHGDASEQAVVPGTAPQGRSGGVRAVHNEIASRAVSGDARLDDLEVARFARIQTLGELAASLAHELGQPLSAIRSNAQAARRFLAGANPQIDEVRAILDDIDADDQRAGEVIHGIRALVQHHHVDMEMIDVNAIVRTAARLVHGDCVLRRVAIVLDLDEPVPSVHGDRVQIQQVLLNLIVNAFAAMRETRQRDRRVIVRTRAAAEGVAISVHDAGTGIAPQHFPQLFDQFFTTKADGLGMGLSIARSIVAAHGGRIWATNNSDCGATFHIVLPYASTTSDQ